MTHVLWRGSLATRIRIVSGLVLMVYLAAHLLNIAAVLVSPAFAAAFQDVRMWVTRAPAGMAIVSAAGIAHLLFSLTKIVQKRSLRMPISEYLQIGLGLSIPLFLSSHVVYTLVATEQLSVDTQIFYLVSLIWGRSDGWLQAIFVLVAWGHGVIGLHMWLGQTAWWRRNLVWLAALGALIPTVALLGYVDAGRTVTEVLGDAGTRSAAFAYWNYPDGTGFRLLAQIDGLTDQIIIASLIALGVVLAIRHTIIALRKPIRVTYTDGPTLRAARGQTVLETSQSGGLAHIALCGGRGRCTTCRVLVSDGGDNLPAPTASELRSLAAVSAAAGTRLACQVRPTGPVTVTRVFGADGKRARSHQGKEAQLAVLFLDMRGFTARTDGQLPYDVVFLLNRFFDEIVPPINAAGGTVDKYMGDGLMAVFETDSAETSAKAALDATQGIGEALARFNAKLDSEGSTPVAIGVGVHLGNVVLGEIGAAGQAPRTLIGDTVNIASRLESETKSLGVEALISESALAAAGVTLSQNALVSLQLRGRDAPLMALALSKANTTSALVAH